jgi:hypothetical protein
MSYIVRGSSVVPWGLNVVPWGLNFLWSFLTGKGNGGRHISNGGLQVRTQTLVKNAIVVVDATPFKQYYQQHYGVELGTKKKIAAGVLDVEAKEKEEEQSHSKHVNRKHQQRAKGHKIDTLVRLFPTPGLFLKSLSRQGNAM